MSHSPGVSVLIAQWGKTDLTVRCVAAVRRSAYGGPIEILVYDNASPGGPGEVAGRSDVRLIQADRNHGFGPAINALAAEANEELILILNNDTLLDPRCIGRLVRRLQGADRPGVVAPQYRSFDGKPLEMGAYIGNSGDAWQLFRGTKPPASLARMSYPADYSSAACLLLERKTFLDQGSFDPLFEPAYYEDTNLCVGLAQQGRATVVEPTAVAFHVEGGTAGTDVYAGMKTFQLRNRTKFIDRWSDWLATRPPVGFEAAITHALTAGAAHRTLWLSPHLPRPDREAGHARMVHMIGALQAAGGRVALWAEHCQDAGRYGPRLEASGVPWFGRPVAGRWGLPPGDPAILQGVEDVLSAVPWDSVIISFPELAQRMIPVVRAHRPSAAILVDNVDLHFLREQRGADLGIASASGTKEWELGIYGDSDGVISASTLETEILLREIPGLPVHTFAVAAEAPAPEPASAGDGALLFLANFNHRPNVDAVEWWLEEIGPAVAQKTGASIPLRVIGAGSDVYADAWLDSHPGLVSIEGWVPRLDDEFRRARVFLAPLRYGAGTKGKIAAAIRHGLPIVTTGVGAEGIMPAVRQALRVEDTAIGIAGEVIELMTDDGAWDSQRRLVFEAAGTAWNRQQALVSEFVAWVRRRQPLRT